VKESYDLEHSLCTVNIPRSELEARISDIETLAGSKASAIALHSGTREGANFVEQLLVANGFTDVTNVGGWESDRTAIDALCDRCPVQHKCTTTGILVTSDCDGAPPNLSHKSPFSGEYSLDINKGCRGAGPSFDEPLRLVDHRGSPGRGLLPDKFVDLDSNGVLWFPKYDKCVTVDYATGLLYANGTAAADCAKFILTAHGAVFEVVSSACLALSPLPTELDEIPLGDSAPSADAPFDWSQFNDANMCSARVQLHSDAASPLDTSAGYANTLQGNVTTSLKMSCYSAPVVAHTSLGIKLALDRNCENAVSMFFATQAPTCDSGSLSFCSASLITAAFDPDECTV
jgi:hypothetical protein